MINDEIARLSSVVIGGTDAINAKLTEMGSTPLNNGTSLAELIRRPELNYDMVSQFDKDRRNIPDDVKVQVNINIKYEGYITREMKQVEHFKKLEKKLIPENIDYDDNMYECILDIYTYFNQENRNDKFKNEILDFSKEMNIYMNS